MTARQAYDLSVEISRETKRPIPVQIGFAVGGYSTGDWQTTLPVEEIRNTKWKYNSFAVRKLYYDCSNEEVYALCQLFSSEHGFLRQDTINGKTVTIVDKGQ